MISFHSGSPRIKRSGNPPTSSSASTSRNKFYRSAQLSPDGSTCLAAAEDHKLSLYSLIDDDDRSDWLPNWTLPSAGPLLSYKWWPGASKEHPATFTFAHAVKDHPVTLVDGTDLRMRASYPIEDHRERFIAPHSMVFSTDGSSLYCGCENAIEKLDIATPGRHASQRIHTTTSRSAKDGQKGIISSLDISPNGSGLLAAGSFSGTIGLYDTSAGENTLVSLIYSASTTGITQLQFHPASHLLYAASRLTSAIELWDIRYSTEIRGTLPREGKTNQRLGFDLNSTGDYLAAGDDKGVVHVYNAEFDLDHQEPVTEFKVSEKRDCVGSTMFHPTLPILVTCSGMRQFEDEDKDDEAEAQELEAVVSQGDDSLKLWNLPIR